MRRHDAAVKLALRGFLLQLGIKSAGYQPIIYRKLGQTVTFKVKGQQVQYTAPVGGNYYVSEISNSISRLDPSDRDDN
jgi:hypothetical protein